MTDWVDRIVIVVCPIVADGAGWLQARALGEWRRARARRWGRRVSHV